MHLPKCPASAVSSGGLWSSLAGPARGQTGKRLSAREIFYSAQAEPPPAKKAAPPQAAPPRQEEAAAETSLRQDHAARRQPGRQPAGRGGSGVLHQRRDHSAGRPLQHPQEGRRESVEVAPDAVFRMRRQNPVARRGERQRVPLHHSPRFEWNMEAAVPLGGDRGRRQPCREGEDVEIRRATCSLSTSSPARRSCSSSSRASRKRTWRS